MTGKTVGLRLASPFQPVTGSTCAKRSHARDSAGRARRGTREGRTRRWGRGGSENRRVADGRNEHQVAAASTQPIGLF